MHTTLETLHDVAAVIRIVRDTNETLAWDATVAVVTDAAACAKQLQNFWTEAVRVNPNQVAEMLRTEIEGWATSVHGEVFVGEDLSDQIDDLALFACRTAEKLNEAAEVVDLLTALSRREEK